MQVIELKKLIESFQQTENYCYRLCRGIFADKHIHLFNFKILFVHLMRD
jgi:hypothetical protein